MAYKKTDNIYKDITENVKTRYDTSNCELDRPLLKEKKRFGLVKDKLGRKS